MQHSIPTYDPSKDEWDRACDIIKRIAEAAGSGRHYLTGSAADAEGSALCTFIFENEDEFVKATMGPLMSFTLFLSMCLSGHFGAGLVMRSISDRGEESLCGWQFVEGDPIPLNRAEMFDFHCTNQRTGDLIPPAPGVDYRDALVIHI
ncbi:hypothetical protein [Streptomyces sp. NPDC090132]|uniref:hypothetical protein n=1 Tax=Streptomyces sp. NPDC090132 TaxID=3365955 RepID=UPI003810B8CB